MTSNIRKNLFKIEDEEYDLLEVSTEPVIENQSMNKKIKRYPKKGVTKGNKITAKRDPKSFPKNETFQLATIKESITLDAKDNPGEIVNHKDHYFISLQQDGDFSWFLLK